MIGTRVILGTHCGRLRQSQIRPRTLAEALQGIEAPLLPLGNRSVYRARATMWLKAKAAARKLAKVVAI
jgi:hypothetical protein